MFSFAKLAKKKPGIRVGICPVGSIARKAITAQYAALKRNPPQRGELTDMLIERIKKLGLKKIRLSVIVVRVVPFESADFFQVLKRNPNYLEMAMNTTALPCLEDKKDTTFDRALEDVILGEEKIRRVSAAKLYGKKKRLKSKVSEHWKKLSKAGIKISALFDYKGGLEIIEGLEKRLELVKDTDFTFALMRQKFSALLGLGRTDEADEILQSFFKRSIDEPFFYSGSFSIYIIRDNYLGAKAAYSLLKKERGEGSGKRAALWAVYSYKRGNKNPYIKLKAEIAAERRGEREKGVNKLIALYAVAKIAEKETGDKGTKLREHIERKELGKQTKRQFDELMRIHKLKI